MCTVWSNTKQNMRQRTEKKTDTEERNSVTIYLKRGSMFKTS